MAYQKQIYQDGVTEYTEELFEHMDDGIFGAYPVQLIAISDTAPSQCVKDDKYYNTNTKKIYTATGTNTWGSIGVNPTQNTLYIDSTNKSTYFYDGSDLISVGGGAGGESLKIGTIVPFAGSTIPDGYLTCDGTAVSRTTYSDLFAVIGTTYGAGDGSTTFNLPNLKGRVPAGLDSNDTDFDTLGETGGSKELQEHSHTLYGYHYVSSGGSEGGHTSGGNITDAQFSTNTSGTGNSGNLQPYIVVNYIIKATKTTPIQAEVVNTQSNSTTDAYSCKYVNDINTYSTNEVNTGKTWIDGKPIYRKVIDLGTLPNISEKTVSAGISTNLDKVVKLYGIAHNPSNKHGFPLPYVYSNNDANIEIVYLGNSDNIRITCNTDRSSLYGYAILEYTKTTD
jgi:microcystin-dependent protein